MRQLLAGHLLLWLGLFASPAHAGDAAQPRLRPVADVDVTYRANTGAAAANGRPLEQRVRWLAQAETMRIDPPTPGLYVIIDYLARRMSVVRIADRAAIDMAAPEGVAGMAGAPAGSTYIRRGDDRVAGVSCTDWETTGQNGQPLLACITSDGVLLRVRVGDQTLVSATAVHYAPQDPALFKVPPDYTRQKAVETAR